MKSTGYILNGIYVKSSDSVDPINAGPESSGSSITYKVYEHDRQRREHAFDMIQPHVNGKPNPEFITHYPTEAKEYGFNQG